jgi:uncharacterized protein
MAWKSKLEKKIKAYLKGYSACHDFYHLERVHNYSLKIAKKLPKNIKYDTNVLWAASFLHDIGYKNNEDDHKNHPVYGVKIAKNWLEEIDFPKEKTSDVLEVIRLHDNFHWEKNGEKTNHIETQIVQDSDRIDAIGAVGVARLAYFFGEKGRPIYNSNTMHKKDGKYFHYNLLGGLEREMKKWDNMNFSISKKMSKKNYVIMKNFYQDLKKELRQHHKLSEGK